MRERFTLRAWPLTPIHIGSGLELTPESFVLDGDRLKSFNPFGVLSRASEAERAQYRQLLNNDNLANAQNHLAKLAVREMRGDDPGIRVSRDCLNDLQKVLSGNPDRGTGRVQPFVRGGETPILPGSSLKGAFRTAWISDHLDESEGREIARTIDGTRTGRAHRELDQLVLEIESSALEQDPFRDLAVADAAVPAGRTRFDRATLGKLRKDEPALDFSGTGGIQMHVERLHSIADGQLVEPLTIDVDIVAPCVAAMRKDQGTRRSKRIVPQTVIDASSLWAAGNRFHADLWRYERDRFYGDAAGHTLDRLLGAFGLLGDPTLAGQLDRAGLVLLRVGRYGQFESKAVKVGGKRHGVKARTFSRQTGETPARPMDQGGTRTAVQIARGLYAPFGWLMLALPGRGPAGAMGVDLSDLARTAPPVQTARAPAGQPARPVSAQATAALAGKAQFRKGERVIHPDHGEARVARDVGVNDTRIEVDFDGEIDSLPLAGWRRR